MLLESKAYIIAGNMEVIEMSKWYIILTVGLILGYAGGAVVGPDKLLKSDSQAKEKAAVAGAVAEFNLAAPDTSAHEAELNELRDRLKAKELEISELNAALDNSRLEIAQRVAELDKKKTSESEKKPDEKSWSERQKERQEQWKKDHPEEYAEMQKRRTEFQEKMEGAIAEKSSFLVNLDTSGMSEEELKGHEELLGRIAEGWEVMNNIQKGKFPTREEMGAMHENYEAIRDLYAKERDYVLRETGKDLGYDEKGSAEFSKHMQEIFENTSATLPRGSMFGGGRGHSSRGSSQPQEAKPDAVAK